MSSLMPLFPLGTVLFPSQVLPLMIFEERYRRLVADLMAAPEPRQFGVIAIREGREIGADGVAALHRTGCVATLRRAELQPDGRYRLVTVGADRFRLVRPAEPAPYPRGEIEPLPEQPGDPAQAAAQAGAVRAAFLSYLEVLSARAGARVSLPDLPDDPSLLSYLVAASMVVDLPVRQRLLEEPGAAARLHAERALLASETRILRSLTSTPAPDLRYSRYSPN